MKCNSWLWLVVGLLGAIQPLQADPAQSAAATVRKELPTRDSLNALLDTYLAALQARQPTRVPWAPGAVYTENNVVLKVGDGLWGTVTALGDYDFRFADPRTGSVAF